MSKMRLGKLEVDLDELQRFVVKAKKRGYAGGTGKRKEPDGSNTFIFQAGDFHYTDNYRGFYQAPGTEQVRWQREDGELIWQMNYSGGMRPQFWGDENLAEETFEFLKGALSQVTFKHPFRGPPNYESSDFSYSATHSGDIKRFIGSEQIIDKRLKTCVFSQEIIGGLAVPK